jgi:plasmid stability protein
MGTTIVVRGLDEAAKGRLRVRAANHDRSMEAEVRAILELAVADPPAEDGDLARLIHADVVAAGADFSGVFDGVRSGEPPRAAALGGAG